MSMTNDASSEPSLPNGSDFLRRLPAEVARWQTAGLVSEEQAAAILQSYDLPAARAGSAIGNRTVSVIAIMGAALIGLGIIAFVAANWSDIPVLAKLALMVVGTPVIYVAGWLLSYRYGFVRIGTAVILLGAVAFGASIHLVAQTYHVPVNHPNLVPLWFLGVVPLAYIIRSRALLGLSIILFLAAAGFRAQEWMPEFEDEALVLLVPAFTMLGAFLFAAGRLQSRFAGVHQFARLCDIAGLLLVATAIYALSFNVFWEEFYEPYFLFEAVLLEYWVVVGVAGVAAFAMVAAAAWRQPEGRSGLILWEAAAVSSMGEIAAVMWLGLAFGGTWLWWLFNLMMLAGVLAMIAAGYRWNRAYLINLAVGFFAITLFTRYFEFGFDLLGQSVAFIVAGVILLAGGFALEYLRRRLVSRMRQAENET